MLKNFSIPISAPKPASVTAQKQGGNELVSENRNGCWQPMFNNRVSAHNGPYSCHTKVTARSLQGTISHGHTEVTWQSKMFIVQGRSLPCWTQQAIRTHCQANSCLASTLTQTKAFLSMDEIFSFVIRFQTLWEGWLVVSVDEQNSSWRHGLRILVMRCDEREHLNFRTTEMLTHFYELLRPSW